MRKAVFLSIVLIVVAAFVLVLPVLAIEPGDLSSAHKDINDNCFSCHTLMLGVSSDECIDCHELDQMDTSLSFHQYLTEDNCMACHALHADKRSQLSENSFSHDLLSDSFIDDNCVSCHGGAMPSDSIHQSITESCGDCHTTSSWSDADFEHEWFAFDKHHPSTCSNCHTVANDYTQYTCYGCHEHSESEIRHEHLEEGISDYQDCVSCHTSGREHDD